MKDSEIYLKAAKLQFEKRYEGFVNSQDNADISLAIAVDYSLHVTRNKFRELFTKNKKDLMVFLNGDEGIMALLFMHQIALDEESR